MKLKFNKVALITGVTGQDGSYLAEFLLQKGYIVHARVRHQMTQVVDLYRSPYFFTTTTGSFAHF